MERNTDAYGKLEYTIGDFDYFICFDYFIRNDGMVELEAVVNSEIGSFVDTCYYQIVPLDEALEKAYFMVRLAEDAMFDNEVDIASDDYENNTIDFIKNLQDELDSL